jgi:hypothetical protein
MARQPMPKALSSLQSVQRSYTSEFSVVVREFGVVFGEEGVVGELLELLESCWSWRVFGVVGVVRELVGW